MNILHIEDEPWDSGMAHYALTLAAEQARRGHRVELWGRADSPVLVDARRLGLAVRGWIGGPAGLLSLPSQRREARTFAPRIINAHTGSAHLLALGLGVSSCAVVRTRGDARPPRGGALARFAAGRTAAFIAVNRALEAELKSVFPAATVALVPQGIEGPEWAPSFPAAPVAGMVARFDKVKGHGVLLDAVARLKARIPGLRARCAGEGRQLERLRWQLKPAGLDGVVEFPGRVDDKWAFMADCRVGLVPSLGSEAVSRSALEWMATGRPVIASNVGGLPDLVEDGVTGLLVTPGDPAALAEALGSLLLDPQKAEALGAAGRERWDTKFALGPFYDATQRVYDEATAHLPS
ncbi:MAG: glycosyltransferase family 4 protein [Elusimicrobiota bacterium]|nr:glycosyltransferase family 4 protein [Elusimicrobiota bacterium]